MNQAEAFAALSLAAVACDGALGREEAHALRTALEHRTPYKDQSETAMVALFDGLLGKLRQSDCDSLAREAVAVLEPHQQETALAVAAELVHSDREVTSEEAAFLERLCALVDLPEEKGRTICEVVATLHRDSLA
ncbi:hypothetical protein EVJ50_05285 [Synechococcus sp. RSCCF101]|uniref:tellurite resistance TerB family protein n=1 Tax=Synechococcus sp. RSCCF101 TaxID=2511069 RepID=UPI001248E52F|nr:tellurite resistance TerB family protein [Synechococcus sp. RSCCF101]QEY31748.1 hypothetical protein EVJ50_05285 [Synechococcus sp. RSCCF101]